MSPTESDRQTIRLPGFLSPFYTIVRPFRLLGEYGLGLKRRLKPDLAVYLPTPKEIVDLMLYFAGLSAQDILYDLGCGDGRIVVAAAEKYGIRAVGVDISTKRIAEARDKARRHGVERRVEFIHGDAKKMDLREASVVTMYLGADANLRLVDHLRADLRPGARIVSRDFKIYGWAPERTENLITAQGVPTSLYLWTIKNSVQESAQTPNAPPETPRASPANSPGEEQTVARASVWQRDK
jgi:SAM-dependent methyltransferase